jgi:hypothetical protein
MLPTVLCTTHPSRWSELLFYLPPTATSVIRATLFAMSMKTRPKLPMTHNQTADTSSEQNEITAASGTVLWLKKFARPIAKGITERTSSPYAKMIIHDITA